MLVGSMMTTLAIAAECPGTTTFAGATCTLQGAGSNGDGRVYCDYSCSDGSQVVKVFTPQAEAQVASQAY